jgi:hypothetical protein
MGSWATFRVDAFAGLWIAGTGSPFVFFGRGGRLSAGSTGAWSTAGESSLCANQLRNASSSAAGDPSLPLSDSTIFDSFGADVRDLDGLSALDS